MGGGRPYDRRRAYVRACCRDVRWPLARALANHMALVRHIADPARFIVVGHANTIATSASADDTSKPLIIAMPKSLAALTDDCTRADIIVASFGIPRTLRKTCEAGSSNHKTGIIIDRFDLWRNGATSLSSPKGEVDDPENWIKETSRGDRGDRPWVQTGRRTRQPVTDIQQKSEVKTPQATKPDVAAGASMDTDAEDTADAAPP